MSILTPINLRCEYFTDPLGIETRSPRLSWQSESGKRNAKQTAWQVLAASTLKALNADKGDAWDSGKVRSDQSTHIDYKGRAMDSCERIYWKVRVWDNDGRVSKWSAPAYWEMGLLTRKDWLGEWIGSSVVGGPRTSSPAPYVRKKVRLERKVTSARLYATALGLYEFYVNGKPVSSDVFRPGWTDYTKRVQYNVYDITALFKKGDNAIGAILGDGWYCGHVGPTNRQVYGDRPRLLAQIVIQFDDGSTQTIITDDSWKTTSSPTLAGDLLIGENYDARLEIPDWCDADFDDSEWSKVKIFSDPGITINTQCGPPVRRMQEIKSPTSLKGYPPAWGFKGGMFDMRQNMVGRVRIKVRGKRGGTVRLRHGEMLDKNGALYTENLRGQFAIDYYTLKGEGDEIWEPKFTFHGFRYVEISSREEMKVVSVTGVVLHSDTPLTGTFKCSDPLVNQLQSNIQWGQRGNFLEVPTDCPQRDERLGWMGDAQVFARTAAFNMDVAPFFTKWQIDIEDAQRDDDAFPPIVPVPDAIGMPKDGGPAWADAGIICPWTIYRCYGDTRILEQHYESLTRFVNYLAKTSRKGVRCFEGCDYFQGFGDWLALDGSGKTEGGTPKQLIGTAFYAYSTRLLGKIAAVLGKTTDAKRREKEFKKIREVFIREFVTDSGKITGGTQTPYVLALHFDLLPERLRPAVVEELVSDIKARGMHLSTGFVGTPYLPHVLSRGGRFDIVYELLHQKTWPSWLYAVTQGATTIWERWDGWTHDKGFQTVGMNSFNHYAYGAIGDWLYINVAGIDLDPEAPGYKHIILRPHPGGGLTSASASLDSIHGKIVSDWKITKGVLAWNVTIPANTTATVYIPAKVRAAIKEGGKNIDKAQGLKFVRDENGAFVYEAGSGSYLFTVREG